LGHQQALTPDVQQTIEKTVLDCRLGRVGNPGLLSALAFEHADGATLVGIQHRADQPGFRGATATATRLDGFRAGHFACTEVIHPAPPKLKHSMVLAGESFLQLVSA